MEDKLKKQGLIEIIHSDKYGKVKNILKLKNTIVNTGLAENSKLIIGTGTPFGYLALGTGTTAVDPTDTDLEAEITDSGLARAAATLSLDTTDIADDTAKFVHTFTATGSKAITEVGIFNASSAGVMLGRRTFSAINAETDDTITITYKIVNS